MRLFGSERIMGMMETLGIDEDTPIDQKILSNAVEICPAERRRPELPGQKERSGI